MSKAFPPVEWEPTFISSDSPVFIFCTPPPSLRETPRSVLRRKNLIFSWINTPGSFPGSPITLKYI